MMAGAGDRASDPKMVAGSDDGAGDLEMVAGAADLKMVAGADVDGAGDDPKMVARADDGAVPEGSAAPEVQYEQEHEAVPEELGAEIQEEPVPEEESNSSYLSSPSQGTPDARIAPVHDPPPQPAREVLLADMVGRMTKANERLETEVLQKPTRIHRFPHHLRGIGGAGGCYVVPSMVAIGPYHHDLPHLQQMEEVKQAAALRLCNYHRRSVQEVYEKILSIADDARRCYDASAVASLSDAEFANMMFLDGCFLLCFWSKDYDGDKLLRGIVNSAVPSFLKDLFLLENQVPLLVLEALRELLPVRLYGAVAQKVKDGLIFSGYDPDSSWIVSFLMKCQRDPDESSISFGDSKPPHLLGLLRFILIHNMPSEMKNSVLNIHGNKSSLSISAVDMEQKGVKLAVSKAEWFADMSVREKLAFGELSLSPMLLDDITACWLANLAALEAADPGNPWGDGYVVSSYLSLLAMLMDRVEDVHELRRSGVLRSRFSNKQTLTYFKGMGLHLRLGHNYYNTLGDIEDYMRRRSVSIAVHQFLYNNYGTVAAVLSIVSVLVGIFQALYSLKKKRGT